LVGGLRLPQLVAEQVGAELSQAPDGWQILTAEPFSEKLVLHVYVALEPTVVVGSETEPLVGALRAPQSVGTQDGAEPLQVPEVPHVRVLDPLKEKPMLQV
jgi:hypothetical protein